MTDRLVLVVGGARSGKSDFAVEFLTRLDRPTTFVATAEAGDADMSARIRRHQQDRPTTWRLVEEPVDLTQAVERIDPEHCVLVDCLTLWTSNLLLADRTEEEILNDAVGLTNVLARRRQVSIVVSNEVGLGVHPGTELGSRYRDILGRVNRTIADRADKSLFFSCGRAFLLADPYELVDPGYG